MKNIKWGRLFLLFIAIVIVQFIFNYLWVWIYSSFVDSTGDQAYYEEYIFRNRFYVNMVICAPLYFFTSRWLGIKAKINPMGQAVALFALHFIFGLFSEFSMGDIPNYFLEYLLFTVIVFVACYLGGKQAEKKIIENYSTR